MNNNTKKSKIILGLSENLIAELSKSSEYFIDERPKLSEREKVDRTEEKKDNRAKILALCEEIQRVVNTKPAEKHIQDALI